MNKEIRRRKIKYFYKKAASYKTLLPPVLWAVYNKLTYSEFMEAVSSRAANNLNLYENYLLSEAVKNVLYSSGFKSSASAKERKILINVIYRLKGKPITELNKCEEENLNSAINIGFARSLGRDGAGPLIGYFHLDQCVYGWQQEDKYKEIYKQYWEDKVDMDCLRLTTERFDCFGEKDIYKAINNSNLLEQIAYLPRRVLSRCMTSLEYMAYENYNLKDLSIAGANKSYKSPNCFTYDELPKNSFEKACEKNPNLPWCPKKFERLPIERYNYSSEFDFNLPKFAPPNIKTWCEMFPFDTSEFQECWNFNNEEFTYEEPKSEFSGEMKDAEWWRTRKGDKEPRDLEDYE